MRRSGPNGDYAAETPYLIYVLCPEDILNESDLIVLHMYGHYSGACRLVPISVDIALPFLQILQLIWRLGIRGWNNGYLSLKCLVRTRLKKEHQDSNRSNYFQGEIPF